MVQQLFYLEAVVKVQVDTVLLEMSGPLEHRFVAFREQQKTVLRRVYELEIAIVFVFEKLVVLFVQVQRILCFER